MLSFENKFNESWIIICKIKHVSKIKIRLNAIEDIDIEVFYNHDGTVITVSLNIFQTKDKLGPLETFYKFPFMGLFLMICIIFVLGLFFGASNLGDSGYDIKNEVTTAQPSAQPSTTSSKLLYFLASHI